MAEDGRPSERGHPGKGCFASVAGLVALLLVACGPDKAPEIQPGAYCSHNGDSGQHAGATYQCKNGSDGRLRWRRP